MGGLAHLQEPLGVDAHRLLEHGGAELRFLADEVVVGIRVEDVGCDHSVRERGVRPPPRTVGLAALEALSQARQCGPEEAIEERLWVDVDNAGESQPTVNHDRGADPLGVICCEPSDHVGAERMAGDDGALNAKPVENREQVADVGLDAVGAGKPVAASAAANVDSEQARTRFEGLRDREPRVAVGGDPMDGQHERFGRTEAVDGERAAGDLDVDPFSCERHGSSLVVRAACGGTGRSTLGVVFERFTDRARQVVVLAQEEARGLRHDYIGTEHILLGLLREEGLAAEVLESVGVTAEGVREQVVRIVGRGAEVSAGQIPFTPRAKKVLELALREALSLGHDYIGSEHILLGLVRENDGVAAQVLLALKADPEKVRDEIVRTSPPEARPRLGSFVQARGRLMHGHGPMRGEWLRGLMPVLGQLGSDISDSLEREPDLGDLLLVLASAPGTIAAEALGEQGIDVDKLWATIERLRREQDALCAKITETQRAKEQAIEAGELKRAASLRDQERELTERWRGRDRVSPEALDVIRRRLGIPRP